LAQVPAQLGISSAWRTFPGRLRERTLYVELVDGRLTAMLSSCLVLILSLLQPSQIVARVEVFTQKASLRATADAAAAEFEFQSALGEALGCGGQVSKEHLEDIANSLQSLQRTLPLNGNGRFDRKSLRHLAYRYFTQRYSIVVRGFEPSRPTFAGNWGNAEILAQKLPGLVEAVLESRHAERGFDLTDASYLVAALERLIFEEENNLLLKAYEAQGLRVEEALNDDEIKTVMEDYLVRWLMGDDEEGARLLLGNRTLLETSFPHWKDLAHFTQGQTRALSYSRGKARKPSAQAMRTRYSYQDAHGVAGSITKSFASFWQSECTDLQDALVAMDSLGTGRVPLSKFYGTGLDEDWRFGESESYLKELGALDETSAWGKQVIIPNYIQAASNCIVTTQHYMLCCMTECNGIMTEIEAKVAQPTAQASHILEIVSNMTSASLWEDDSFHIGDSLAAQLRSVEAAHGGEVPLHGRLYLQWLHYAFPRQCPFPHKTGSVAVTAPSEFSGDYVASLQDMQAIRARENETVLPSNATAAKEELQWMSQWSEEEELLVTYEGLQGSISWRSFFIAGGAVALLAASVAGTVKISHHKASSYHRRLPV